MKHEALNLIARVPKPPNYELPSGASEASINALEAEYAIKLPTDLKEWLLLQVGPGGMIGIDVAFKLLEMRRMFERRPRLLERGLIPVAGDGVGNLYAIDQEERQGAHAVVFIDHETDSSYAVASGFWPFLFFILSAELGEKRWPFSREYVLSIDPDLVYLQGILPLP